MFGRVYIICNALSTLYWLLFWFKCGSFGIYKILEVPEIIIYSRLVLMALVLQDLKISGFPVKWCLQKHHGGVKTSEATNIHCSSVNCIYISMSSARAAQYVVFLLQRGMTSAVTLSSLWGRHSVASCLHWQLSLQELVQPTDLTRYCTDLQ